MDCNNDLCPIEVIFGQIVAKANNYQAVPDKATGGRRIIKSDKVRAYERTFAAQCRIYAGKRINRPFELVTTVYYSRPTYDLDNSLKTLLDCLQYVGAITDDNLCTRIVADKQIDRYKPRVEFAIIAEPPTPSLFDECG
jgi:Holliday junction resolvase RusA-like endonuclease